MLIEVLLDFASLLRLRLADFFVLFLELLVLPVVLSCDIFELGFDDFCLVCSVRVLESLAVEELAIGC